MYFKNVGFFLCFFSLGALLSKINTLSSIHPIMKHKETRKSLDTGDLQQLQNGKTRAVCFLLCYQNHFWQVQGT